MTSSRRERCPQASSAAATKRRDFARQFYRATMRPPGQCKTTSDPPDTDRGLPLPNTESTSEPPTITPLAAHTTKREATIVKMVPAKEPTKRTTIRGRHPGLHVRDPVQCPHHRGAGARHAVPTKSSPASVSRASCRPNQAWLPFVYRARQIKCGDRESNLPWRGALAAGPSPPFFHADRRTRAGQMQRPAGSRPSRPDSTQGSQTGGESQRKERQRARAAAMVATTKGVTAKAPAMPTKAGAAASFVRSEELAMATRWPASEQRRRSGHAREEKGNGWCVARVVVNFAAASEVPKNFTRSHFSGCPKNLEGFFAFS